jgi:segregation and condensation protein B
LSQVDNGYLSDRNFGLETAKLNKRQIKKIVEGLIFAHPEPLGLSSIRNVLREIPPNDVIGVLIELEEEYQKRDGGFLLVKVAEGYQFRTVSDVSPWILQMKNLKPAKLSRATLETLAIIAYNQPVTRGEIEQIRGVESSSIVRNLVERDLVLILGRKDTHGKPLLYGTTRRFLEVFGLKDLASLPPFPKQDVQF